MVHAQEPTCTDLRIRSTQDTHKIFYAIQKGVLKMVTRRLDADERLALRSGCVYAWEERGPHSEITGLGIERFTEGRRWTPSRVRDEFLFYYERYQPPPDATGSGSPADTKPPRDWEPLVKQTYSVWVDTDNGRRKWHITAYFTQGTIDQLRCVDDIPGVGDLVVPEGHFKSTRVGKRAKTDEAKGESSKSAVSRTYAAFPSPYSTTSPAVESPSVLMYEPYRDTSSSTQQQTAFYHLQDHSDDRSQTRSSSHEHQDRSSASLSPPLPNDRIHYTGQMQSYNPVGQEDFKSSRMEVPAPSSLPSQPHPSQFRTHSSMALSGAMGPMNDSIHGQRGKPVPISTYAESGGLNNVNPLVDPHSNSYARPSPWNAGNTTNYVYRTPSVSPGLPPSVSPPVQLMNNHGGHLHSGYMAYMQQPQQPAYHTGPTTLNHNGMPGMPQEYMTTATDAVPLSSHTSETPRTLPPLQIPYEEPPYIYHNSPDYQQVIPHHPLPTPPPSRDPNCRPGQALALAPLTTLSRGPAYKRLPLDDKALRLLQQNPPSTSPQY